MYHDEIDVLSRITTFNLDHGSEMKRLDRLFYVIDIVASENYFGHWFLSTSFLYFDGIISFIIYNTGCLGLIIFLLSLIFLSYSFLRKGNYSTLYLLLAVVSQISSESFLISRWFFPIIIYYLILKKVFTIKYISTT